MWWPEVSDLASTSDVVALLRAAASAVILHVLAERPMADVPVQADGEVVIVVGPEGGLTDAELSQFTDAGAVAVTPRPQRAPDLDRRPGRGRRDLVPHPSLGLTSGLVCGTSAGAVVSHTKPSVAAQEMVNVAVAMCRLRPSSAEASYASKTYPR